MDPRITELIHAEIDGINSDDASTELRAILAREPEARELYADLVRVNRILGRIEPQAPPAGLRQAILREIDTLPAPGAAVRVEEKVPAAPADPAHGTPWWRRLFDAPGSRGAVLRYAYIFAAGVVLAVVAIKAPWQDLAGSQALTGTLAPPADSAAAVWPSTIVLEAEGFRGRAELSQPGRRIFLSFTLEADETLEVALDFDEAVLGFARFTQDGDAVSALEADQGRIVVQGRTGPRYTVELERKQNVGTTLGLSVFRRGAPLVERIVELQPTNFSESGR